MHPADEPFELREIWPPGTLIKGDFVIERRLGGGGFGTVYLARNRYFNNLNVIKRLHDHFASDREFVRKFFNEGLVMRRLRGCPHIIDIEQMTQTEDRHLILVMEYVPGGDLAELAASRRLTVDEVIEFARQIALGLQVAHQAGLVHRDIKPQNVLMGVDAAGKPQLKLIDFGIAADQMSQHQTSVMRGGSIGYAAPEQWAKAGKELDGRTDLYSLGVTMHWLLTGQMPFPDVFDIGTWLDRVKSGPAEMVSEVRGDVPVALSGLIGELMAMRVEDRPADAGAVIGRLEGIRAGGSHPRTEAMPAPVERRTVSDAPVPPRAPTRVEMPAPAQVASQPAARVTEKHSVKDEIAPEKGNGVGPREASADTAKPHPLKMAEGVKQPPNRQWVWALSGLVLIAGAYGAWKASAGAVDPPVPVAKDVGRSGGTEQKLNAREPKVNPKDGLTYVPIPAGTFEMGCSFGDQECFKNESPKHTVEITKGFLLGRTEVTQAAYEKVTGKTPSYFQGAELPVEQVSWEEAKEYCGLIGGRLPSEAEWEYAARGGSPSARYGNLDEVAWYDKNSGSKAQAVGGLKANGFGLFDMLGNVLEWTNDWYDDSYYKQAVKTNPQGPSTGIEKALRGGSWDYNPRVVRASVRGWAVPGGRLKFIGFRCVWE